MRFCGIVTSLLLVHNLPPNWTNTFSQNLERSTLTNRPISTPHTHKLTVNCYFRGNPAGPLSKGSKIALIWWAWKDETEAKQPHLSLFLGSFFPLASLTVCFSPKGKLKPVWFVFLLLLAVRLLLKPRCWWAGSRLSQKHEVDRRFIGEDWTCEEGGCHGCISVHLCL